MVWKPGPLHIRGLTAASTGGHGDLGRLCAVVWNPGPLHIRGLTNLLLDVQPREAALNLKQTSDSPGGRQGPTSRVQVSGCGVGPQSLHP